MNQGYFEMFYPKSCGQFLRFKKRLSVSYWPLVAGVVHCGAAAGWVCPSLPGWTVAFGAELPELPPECPSPSSSSPSSAPSQPVGKTTTPDHQQDGLIVGNTGSTLGVHRWGWSLAYQLALLSSEALSVLHEPPHVLVPLVLGLFGLANQQQLLLQPLPALGLVLLQTQLDTEGFSFQNLQGLVRLMLLTSQNGFWHLWEHVLPSSSPEPVQLPVWLLWRHLIGCRPVGGFHHPAAEAFLLTSPLLERFKTKDWNHQSSGVWWPLCHFFTSSSFTQTQRF